jgi:hypothetical protein
MCLATRCDVLRTWLQPEQQQLLQVKQDLAYARSLQAAEERAWMERTAAGDAGWAGALHTVTDEFAGPRDAQLCLDFEYARQLQLDEDAAAAACWSSRATIAAPECARGRGGGAWEAAGAAEIEDWRQAAVAGRVASTEDDLVLLGVEREGSEGDCDEDVCPDIHEMFRYFDEIYFGYVCARHTHTLTHTHTHTCIMHPRAPNTGTYRREAQ